MILSVQYGLLVGYWWVIKCVGMGREEKGDGRRETRVGNGGVLLPIMELS